MSSIACDGSILLILCWSTTSGYNSIPRYTRTYWCCNLPVGIFCMISCRWWCIRCQTMPNISPPGCATSRLHPAAHALLTEMVTKATSLEEWKNLFRIDHLQPWFYRPWKFGRHRSCRFWNNWSDRNCSEIYKKQNIVRRASFQQPSGLKMRVVI